MRDKLYDNADSFAMSFDEEWKNIDCDQDDTNQVHIKDWVLGIVRN